MFFRVQHVETDPVSREPLTLPCSPLTQPSAIPILGLVIIQ